MKIHSNSIPSTVATTLSSEKVINHTMARESANIQMLMLRTGLYSDKIGAVVREYLTNARDAHVEAGQTAPIDVTIPTRFGNSFIIRDYGPGMSQHFIENTYVQYTASTKRLSETLTGGWGIGSKSGYAYTDSFSVISYFEGKKQVWLAQSNPDGSGTYTLLSTTESDEPSGVAIVINLNSSEDSYKFNSAVNHFSAFMDIPVSINGVDCGNCADNSSPEKTPVIFKSDEVTIELRTIGSQNRYNKKAYIVQGGVPYPVGLDDVINKLESSILLDYARSYNCLKSICIHVPPGTFMPDISRENLQLDASGKSLETICSYIEAADSYLSSIVKDNSQFNQMTNFQLSCFSNNPSMVDIGSWLIEANNGKKIPSVVLDVVKQKAKFVIRKIATKSKTVFCSSFSTYRKIVLTGYSGDTVSTQYINANVDNLICDVTGDGKVATILHCNSSHQRNTRIKSFLATSGHNRSRVLVAENKTTFDLFKKTIIDNINCPDSSLNGIDITKINIVNLSDYASSSKSVKSVGRRSTKFMKVTDCDWNDKIATKPIKAHEVETDLKVIYGLLYRNQLVNEHGQLLSVSRSFIKNLINSTTLEFRVIKISEFKNNSNLKRNKIDFSTMISLLEFSDLCSQFSTYLHSMSEFDKSIEEVEDQVTSKLVLKAIKHCREEIETHNVINEMNSKNLLEEDMVSYLKTTIDTPSIEKFLLNNFPDSTVHKVIKIFNAFSWRDQIPNKSILDISIAEPLLF